MDFVNAIDHLLGDDGAPTIDERVEFLLGTGMSDTQVDFVKACALRFILKSALTHHSEDMIN